MRIPLSIHNPKAGRYLADIFDRMPLGGHMYRLDDAGDLVFLKGNKAACKILGFNHDSLIGLPIREAFPGLTSTDIPSEYKKIAREGGILQRDQIDYLHGKINGAFEIIAFQVEPDLMAVFFRDILDRKKMEEALQEAVESKDRFLAILAHDLRNPFQVMTSYASMLDTQYDQLNDAERKEAIRGILRTSRNTFQLLVTLLDWGRLQSGRMEKQVSTVNVSEEVSEIVDLIGNVAGAKDIRIQWSIGHDLKVVADRNMLRTIILNLLSNAIKFTPQSGQISFSASQADDSALFVVSDNGTGMTASERDMLFRIDHCSSREGTAGEKGSGLGLIVCKEMIELQGGTIIVESEPGKGSTFRFTLPLPATMTDVSGSQL
jgi:signal transduction histidine kinase